MIEVIKYPKVRKLSEVANLIPPDHPVVIQPKLDGSNVAIRVVDGALVLQSRETIIDQARPGMFAPFVEWAQGRRWEFTSLVLYGEMVQNQGKIKYQEKQPFVMFDVYRQDGLYPDGTYEADLDWAADEGLGQIPVVPTLWEGPWSEAPISELTGRLTDQDEGFVVKAYGVPWCRWWGDEDGVRGEECSALPIVAGKVVTERFKETKAAPTAMKKVDDPIDTIAGRLVTPARVDKARARLLESGASPFDVKPHQVIAGVARDAHDEDESIVKDWLYTAYWGQISRRIPAKVLSLIGQEAE